MFFFFRTFRIEFSSNINTRVYFRIARAMKYSMRRYRCGRAVVSLVRGTGFSGRNCTICTRFRKRATVCVFFEYTRPRAIFINGGRLRDMEEGGSRGRGEYFLETIRRCLPLKEGATAAASWPQIRADSDRYVARFGGADFATATETNLGLENPSRVSTFVNGNDHHLRSDDPRERERAYSSPGRGMIPRNDLSRFEAPRHRSLHPL